MRSGPLADVLPPVTLAAKNLATEMTNLNVEQKDLQGESSITHEHVQNNSSVRSMLLGRGIRPEDLPPEEDIKKLERRLKSEEKKLAKGKDILIWQCPLVKSHRGGCEHCCSLLHPLFVLLADMMIFEKKAVTK